MKRDRRLQWFLMCVVSVLVLSLAAGCGEGDNGPTDGNGTPVEASVTVDSATCTLTADAGGLILLLKGYGSASSPTTGLLVSFTAEAPGIQRWSGTPVCTNWSNCRRALGDPQTTEWTGTVVCIRAEEDRPATTNAIIILRGAFGDDIVDTLSVQCQ